MNKQIHLQKAEVGLTDNLMVFSRVVGPLVVFVDWEKKELRIHADEFHEAPPEQQKALIEKFLLYKPRERFVRVFGDLHKIRGIDVDCSDVTKEEACEEDCSCDSEKQSPPLTCSNCEC